MAYCSHVIAGWGLMHAQPEFGNNRESVIKNIGLNAFILRPHRCIGEGLDFQRQAVRRWRKLTNHERHVFADLRVRI